MDVTQDFNRNVMNALYYLQSNGTDCFVEREKIALQVRRQMRGHKGNQIDKYITDSLDNLTCFGVLVQTGNSAYALRHTLSFGGVRIPTRSPDEINHGHRYLDPRNSTTSLITNESISGDKLTKARKRLRSNNKRLPVYKGKSKPRKPAKLAEAPINVAIRRRKRKEYLSSQNDTIAAFRNAHKKLMKETATQQNLCYIKSHSNRASHDMVTTASNSGECQLVVPLGQVAPGLQPLVADYGLPPLGTTSADFNMLLQPNTDNASIIGLCGSENRMITGFEKHWTPFWERTSGAVANFVAEPEKNPLEEDPFVWVPLSTNANYWN